MKDTIFDTIHNNQTIISATVTILVLATASVIATSFTLKNVLESESIVGYLVYQKGFRDASTRATEISFVEFRRDELLRAVEEIVFVLKISCCLSLLSSLLHFTSSAWTIFKRSLMSKTTWLAAQLVTLALLLTSVSLPMSYQLRGPLTLNIYYATLLVDAFLTLLLLFVVYMDNKFLEHSPVNEPTSEETGDSNKVTSTVQEDSSNVITSQVIMPPTTMSVTITATGPSSNNTDEEPLPPPPPIPATAQSSSATSNPAA